MILPTNLLLLVRLLVPCTAFSAVSNRFGQDARPSSFARNQEPKSLTQLHLFAMNSKSGDSADANSEKKGSSRIESNSKGDAMNAEDVENFSAFLNRMGSLPLVETLEDKPARSGKRRKDETVMATSVASPRNPFLSPFASLLNVDEVIQVKERDETSANITGTISNTNNEVNDVMDSWGIFISTLQKSFGEGGNGAITTTGTSSTATPPTTPTMDDLLKTATNRVESALFVASTAVSPAVFTAVVNQARTVLKFQDDLVVMATSAARDRGLDGVEAAERARNTTAYVATLVLVADQVLRYGYVRKEENVAIGNRQRRKEDANKLLEDSATVPSSPGAPLFDRIPSAHAVSYSDFGPVISTIAEMGWLSGGIYEDALERSFELGHSIVAEGISADVFWMVTDSTENEADFHENSSNDERKPGKDIPVRTIIIRGFDASDDRVDREVLFTEICNLKSQVFDEKIPELLVHRGMFQLAEAVYKDVQKYINWSAPAQKIILTGHSVGGSISILVMLMLARDRGAEFVREKILRVFSFGSPPSVMINPDVKSSSGTAGGSEGCRILDVFGLPASLVYGSVQPWDPIPRLFSEIDGLYPLVDDLGLDGKTLYASGPPRSLRLVAKALVDAWDGWGNYRDMILAAGPQKYEHVGLQHIILPEPARFLSDRFVNVNVNIPAVDEIVRVSPDELYTALESLFPLDVFELSYLTSGIRGFLHHFFPAYDLPLVQYAQKVSKKSTIQTLQEKRMKNIETESLGGKDEEARTSGGQAEDWLKSVVPAEPSR